MHKKEENPTSSLGRAEKREKLPSVRSLLRQRLRRADTASGESLRQLPVARCSLACATHSDPLHLHSFRRRWEKARGRQKTHLLFHRNVNGEIAHDQIERVAGVDVIVGGILPGPEGKDGPRTQHIIT